LSQRTYDEFYNIFTDIQVVNLTIESIKACTDPNSVLEFVP